MKIKAYDEEGREIEKDSGIRIVLSFGWPCEYSLETLKDHDFSKPLCIDAGGRNHNASPTYVKGEDVKRLVDAAIQAKSIIPSELQSSR